MGAKNFFSVKNLILTVQNWSHIALLFALILLSCKGNKNEESNETRDINKQNLDTIRFANDKDIVVGITLSEVEYEKQKNIEGLNESISDFKFYFNKAADKLKPCNLEFFISASKFIKIGSQIVNKDEVKEDSFLILIKKEGTFKISKDSFTDVDLINELGKEYNLKSCLPSENLDSVQNSQ